MKLIYLVLLLVLPVESEDVLLLETCDLVKRTGPATMYKFRILRHATWEYVVQVKGRHPTLAFYKSNEDGILAMFGSNELRTVIRPYNRNMVRLLILFVIGKHYNYYSYFFIQERISKKVVLEPVDEVEAEAEWKRSVDCILGNRNAKCEHESLTNNPCKKLKESRTCTYHWAVTECLLICGQMSLIAESLEKRLSVPTEIGKVTWTHDATQKCVTGLLVSYENSRFSISDVFDKVKEF